MSLNMKQMPAHDRTCEGYEPAGILVHPAPSQQGGHKVVTLYPSYNLKTTKKGNESVFFNKPGKIQITRRK